MADREPWLGDDDATGIYLMWAPADFTPEQAAALMKRMALAEWGFPIIIDPDPPKLVYRRDPEGDEDEESMPLVDASDPRAQAIWESEYDEAPTCEGCRGEAVVLLERDDGAMLCRACSSLPGRVLTDSDAESREQP